MSLRHSLLLPRPRRALRLLVLASWVAACAGGPADAPGRPCATAGCAPVATCTDDGGAAVCACPGGYDGDGLTCTPHAALAFALMDGGDARAQLDAYLAMDAVDGVAVRLAWSTLEASDDVFTWARVDEAFAAAAATGKRVTLHVLGSGYVAAPAWLSGLGAQTYAYTPPGGGAERRDPVPWDPVFLAEWAELLAELRAHLDDTGDLPLLYAISVAVPVPEVSLVACSDGVLQASPVTIAYDPAAYLGAWEAAVDAATASFPDTGKLLPVPVATICRPDTDGPSFHEDVWTYARAADDTYAHYATDLTTLESDRLEGITSLLGARTAAVQFIWSYTSDVNDRMEKGTSGRTFLDAVCRGHAYGAGYFEIYKVDLESLDPAVQQGVSAVRDPSPCP